MNKYVDPFDGTCKDINPMFLSAKLNNSNTPTYHQAMNMSNSAGYMDAMDDEVCSLQETMNA